MPCRTRRVLQVLPGAFSDLPAEPEGRSVSYCKNDAADKPLLMLPEGVSSVGLFSRSTCGESGEKHARRACTLLAGGHARRGKSS